MQDFGAMAQEVQDSVPMAQEPTEELMPDLDTTPPAWWAGAWMHIERKMDMSSEDMGKLFERQSARMDTTEMRLQAGAENSEHALRRV